MNPRRRPIAAFLRLCVFVSTILALAGCPETGSPAPSGSASVDGGGGGGTVVAGDVAVNDGSEPGSGSGSPSGGGDGSGTSGGDSGSGTQTGDGSGGSSADGDGGGSDGGGSDGGSNGGSGSVDAPAPPRLVISTSLLNFGSADEELVLTLSNGGTGEVSFLVSSTDPWISFSPTAGIIGSTPVDVTVRVNRTNLWLGTFWSSVSARGSDDSSLGVVVIVNKSGVPAPHDQLVAWMRQLPPLPRRHFTWKPDYDFYQRLDEDLLYEFIRINNGVTWADWPNAAMIDRLVRLCKLVNQTNPTLPAALAVVDSPYYRHWPIDAPPTYSGPERAQEIASQGEQLATLATYLATSNARYNGPNIEVAAIAYDTELWRLREPDAPDYLTWNGAMRANYDAIYDITKVHFPNVPIDWYSRGWIRFFGNFEPPSFADVPYYHFDLSEQGDVCSAVLYRLPMQWSSREAYVRTVQYAAGNGVDQVVPWIALGAGYRPTEDNTNVYYDPNWNYDMQVAWNFGREINDPTNSTWDPAPWVMIYPSPFQANTPYFGQHFVAYVRGAHNVPGLPR
ncbi:MAG: BACON domain-containing protein [Phycisphaerales bacterium]|nr:BACON domain-containing protein [Phycisphaerales bacterium]